MCRESPPLEIRNVSLQLKEFKFIFNRELVILLEMWPSFHEVHWKIWTFTQKHNRHMSHDHISTIPDYDYTVECQALTSSGWPWP